MFSLYFNYIYLCWYLSLSKIQMYNFFLLFNFDRCNYIYIDSSCQKALNFDVRHIRADVSNDLTISTIKMKTRTKTAKYSNPRPLVIRSDKQITIKAQFTFISLMS